MFHLVVMVTSGIICKQSGAYHNRFVELHFVCSFGMSWKELLCLKGTIYASQNQEEEILHILKIEGKNT